MAIWKSVEPAKVFMGKLSHSGEFILQVFDGPLFERAFDGETGLPLWAMEE